MAPAAHVDSSITSGSCEMDGGKSSHFAVCEPQPADDLADEVLSLQERARQQAVLLERFGFGRDTGGVDPHVALKEHRPFPGVLELENDDGSQLTFPAVGLRIDIIDMLPVFSFHELNNSAFFRKYTLSCFPHGHSSTGATVNVQPLDSNRSFKFEVTHGELIATVNVNAPTHIEECPLERTVTRWPASRPLRGRWASSSDAKLQDYSVRWGQ